MANEKLINELCKIQIFFAGNKKQRTQANLALSKLLDELWEIRELLNGDGVVSSGDKNIADLKLKSLIDDLSIKHKSPSLTLETKNETS